MNQPCKDGYSRTFDTLDEFLSFHLEMDESSEWRRIPVCSLRILPLDEALAGDITRFAHSSMDAVGDTMNNLGLAVEIADENGETLMPIRNTAFKSLLDRAKINGTVLQRLPRENLADILNQCLAHHTASDALLLLRNEKVCAFHSGDEKDYSVLPIPELTNALRDMLDTRFPEYEFSAGYMDHTLSTAMITFPKQRDDLLDEYDRALRASGAAGGMGKLMPGIRFTTSDAGVSCAEVSALFVGGPWPINIGNVASVRHRGKTTVTQFQDEIEGIYAKYRDTVKALASLLDVYVQYLVTTMANICKKLATPKKETAEAISIFEMTYGGGACSAHEIYMGMQEILFFMKSNGVDQAKLLKTEEAITRALTLHWEDFDIARAA